MTNTKHQNPSGAPRRKMHWALYNYLQEEPSPNTNLMLFYGERAAMVSLWYTTDKLNFRRDATEQQVREAISDESNYLGDDFLFAATGLFTPSQLSARVWSDVPGTTLYNTVLSRLRDAVKSCIETTLVYERSYK